MSIQAFTYSRILQLDSPKIDTAAAAYGPNDHDSYLYIAHDGGKLVCHHLISSPVYEAEYACQEFQLNKSTSQVASKKKITRILPVLSQSRVYVLSAGTVSAFSSPSLSPVFCDIDTANVLDIAYDTCTHSLIHSLTHSVTTPSSPTLSPSHSLTQYSDIIAVLIKKKLLFFEYQQGRFLPAHSIDLPNTPNSISLTNRTLSLIYKDHITLLDIMAGKTGVETIENAELKTQFKNNSSALYRLVGERGVLFMENNQTLSISPLSPTQSPSTTPLTHSSIHLPTPPLSLALTFPYVLVAGESVSVYSVLDGRLVDTIPLPNITVLLDSSPTHSQTNKNSLNPLFAIDATGMICVIDYADSDALIQKLMVDERMSEAFCVLGRVVLSYGTLLNASDLYRNACISLFSKLDFTHSFTYFQLSQCDVRELLTLFSDLYPSELKYERQVMNEFVLGRNVHGMTDYILSSLKQRSDNPASITVDSRDYLRIMGEAKTALESLLVSERVKVCDRWEKEKKQGDFVMMRIIEYALLRLFHSRSATLEAHSLISSTIFLLESDLLSISREMKCYAQLSKYYCANGKLGQSLSVLRQLHEGVLTDPSIDPVKESVREMRDSATSDLLELIRVNAPWIFKARPEEAIKIFTYSSSATSPIKDFVFELLKTANEPLASDFRRRYVTHLVTRENETSAQVNTEYVTILLNSLTQQARSLSLSLDVVKKDETPKQLQLMRESLIKTLINNQFYSPSDVWRDISDSVLYFEKIIVLARLGRHEDALNIIIRSLRSLTQATDYCLTHSSASDFMNSASDMNNIDKFPWLLLIRILMTEESDDRKDSFRKAAIDILQNYGSLINPLTVLSLLPPDVRMSELLGYVSVAASHSILLAREARIKKGMYEVMVCESQINYEMIGNTNVTFESSHRCIVCGSKFMKGDVPALTADVQRVHDKCMSREMKIGCHYFN